MNKNIPINKQYESGAGSCNIFIDLTRKFDGKSVTMSKGSQLDSILFLEFQKQKSSNQKPFHIRSKLFKRWFRD